MGGNKQIRMRPDPQSSQFLQNPSVALAGPIKPLKNLLIKKKQATNFVSEASQYLDMVQKMLAVQQGL